MIVLLDPWPTSPHTRDSATPPDPDVERVISAAATATCDGLERGHRVGLIARARIPIVIPPAQGRPHRQRLLHELALLSDGSSEPMDELIARIRAVLRRAGHPALAGPDRDATRLVAFGALRLDRENRELIGADGTEIALTNAEYRLLDYFLLHPGRVIPRTELLAELGSDISQYVDRTIDVLILRLRRKIETVPSKPVHLQTRRGQGYIFITGPAQ